MKKLSKVTTELGKSYKAWKKAEREKDKHRKEFFQIINEEVDLVLARNVVEVPQDGSVEEYVEKYYPGWTILEVREEDDRRLAVLEEDKSFKAFTFINPEDGQVYTRTISRGSIYVDEERLQEDDPEFWEEISFVPTERQLRPLEELTEEQVAKLQGYMFEGKPTIKLSAPRKAKPEELEEASK